MSVSIRFNVETPKVRITNVKTLRAFLLNKIAKTGFNLDDLSFTIISDEALLKMNKSHLNHDYYTDIITFDLSSSPNSILGDVYISADRVKENSLQNDASFNHELHRVIFHGLLHLLGFNDKTNRQQHLMRTKEEEWLEEYF